MAYELLLVCNVKVMRWIRRRNVWQLNFAVKLIQKAYVDAVVSQTTISVSQMVSRG
jgi:hypothetical protein